MQPINQVSSNDVELFAEQTERRNSLDLYQKLATRSAIYPGQGTPFGLMYAALGLAEAGEFQNKVKKIYRDDLGPRIGISAWHRFSNTDPSIISEERKAQLIKELGGLLWYAAACCNEIGTTLAAVAVANLRELASRAERGTLAGSGDDR